MAYNVQKMPLFAFLVLNLALMVFAQGTQFITGPCANDAACASSCCGFNSGKCAGPVIAQERDGGCGFGDAQPNDIAAKKFFAQQGAAQPAAAKPATTLATVIVPQAAATNAVAAGTQFITGPCANDAACASSCCGFNSGKCAGPVIAQERDGGCGFGDAKPNDIAAQKFRAQEKVANAPAAAPVAAPKPATGAAPGTQFITGACANDAACASSCCGFNSGKCAGPVIAQERDGGCGFGDAKPNDIAAQKFRAQEAAGAGAPAAAPAAAPKPATGAAPGTQFITGACANDAACASGCCGFNSGKCAGPIIAQERDGGCGFGDAKPNDIAAQKLRGGR